MPANDQQCSSRKEDWQRFGAAWLQVLHTGKNILVEEWRRIRGKCSEGDEHASEQ